MINAQELFFLILLSLTIMMPVAFAQEDMVSNQKIVLIADNTAYQEGDVITITGSVEKVIPGMPISLQIFFVEKFNPSITS